MREKIKPNVLILAGMATALTLVLVIKLIGHDEFVGEDFPFGEVVSMIIGIGIGSLLTIASQVAQDPPPPTVPAHIVEKMLDGGSD